MDGEEQLKDRWRGVLARMGAAGRDWRKAAASEAASSAFDGEGLDYLRREIKAQRRARAEGHWSFRPERLRILLARYIAARRARKRSV